MLYAGRLASGVRDLLNGDFNTMKRSLAEKDTLLSQMLTPQEKFEYDTRLSYTAVSLQNRLGDFAPSEQEFRDLVRLQKQYDDNYGPLSLAASGRDVSQERAVAQKELETQTRALLGDERYQEYQHEQTWVRSSFRNVAQEYGIPKQTAFQVFDITDVAGQQADAIRGDAMLSQSQKQATPMTWCAALSKSTSCRGAKCASDCTRAWPPATASLTRRRSMCSSALTAKSSSLLHWICGAS